MAFPGKIYQNELSVDGGFSGEQDAWLANFTDNPIEFFFRNLMSNFLQDILAIYKAVILYLLKLPMQRSNYRQMTAGSKEYDDLVKKLKR